MHEELELTLCSATLLSEPTRPTPESLFQQLSAARHAGFSGISLWTLHHQAALRGGHSREDVLAAVRAHGMKIPMVFLTH